MIETRVSSTDTFQARILGFRTSGQCLGSSCRFDVSPTPIQVFLCHLTFISSFLIYPSHSRLSPLTLILSFSYPKSTIRLSAAKFLTTPRIAAAFTSVVTSFVSEILLPPLSLIPGINRNMEGKFAILRRGPNYNNTDGLGYNTLQQAADDGAVVMAYGYLPSSSTAEPS